MHISIPQAYWTKNSVFASLKQLSIWKVLKNCEKTQKLTRCFGFWANLRPLCVIVLLPSGFHLPKEDYGITNSFVIDGVNTPEHKTLQELDKVFLIFKNSIKSDEFYACGFSGHFGVPFDLWSHLKKPLRIHVASN